jgi:uncharacterized membrane protein
VAAPLRTNVYHRWLGRSAPALLRAIVVIAVGVVAVLILLLTDAPWELAVIVGWNATATTFIASAWHLIVRADSTDTRDLAGQEDETRTVGSVLLVAVCVGGLLGVVFALGLARDESGSLRVLLIALAALTVAVSWTMLNTIYTLRYAHLYYAPDGRNINFNDPNGPPPSYRDFAYVAFTIGMTYQVSDTNVRDERTRRTVLVHSLLAYLFGVVIIAGAINLAAGLLR